VTHNELQEGAPDVCSMLGSVRPDAHKGSLIGIELSWPPAWRGSANSSSERLISHRVRFREGTARSARQSRTSSVSAVGVLPIS